MTILSDTDAVYNNALIILFEGPNRADIYTAAASDWIMQGPHEERQVVRVRNENAAGTPASQNSSLYRYA